MTITSTSIDLSWSVPAGGGAPTYGYTVVQRVTGSGAFSIVAEGLTATTYEVTGLTPTTSYDFGVFAVNHAGPGSMGVVTQATLGEVPNPPSELIASAGSPAYSAVVLSWSAPPTDSTDGPATSYIVEYALHGSGAWNIAMNNVATTSYTVTGLAHHTVYDFQVLGVNSAGTGLASTPVTLTTDYAPPNPPTITSVIPVNDGTTSKLTVLWTPPATDATHGAATGYNLQYSVHDAGSWTVVSGISSPYTITGLAAGTVYDWQIQGTNASATSPSAWSGSTTGTTYSVAVTWGVSGQPQSSFTHGSGNINGVSNAGMNANTSPNPSAMYFDAGTSNSVLPTNELTSVSYAGSTYQWADYYPVPATPGTYYFWAIAENSGAVVGALVSGAITVS